MIIQLRVRVVLRSTVKIGWCWLMFGQPEKKSSSETIGLCNVSICYKYSQLVIDACKCMISQWSYDVIGELSVKPKCTCRWLWFNCKQWLVHFDPSSSKVLHALCNYNKTFKCTHYYNSFFWWRMILCVHVGNNNIAINTYTQNVPPSLWTSIKQHHWSWNCEDLQKENQSMYKTADNSMSEMHNNL